MGVTVDTIQRGFLPCFICFLVSTMVSCSELGGAGASSSAAPSSTLQARRGPDAQTPRDVTDSSSSHDSAPQRHVSDIRKGVPNVRRDDANTNQEVDDGQPTSRPLHGLSDRELEYLLLNTPEKLGSIALGPPDAGALMNAVAMPEGERWKIVKSTQSWGTQETAVFIQAAINKVHEQHEETHPLYVGDISRKRGGYFYPHTFHQNGRDVDLGFYYKAPVRWYTRAWMSNLDVPRTWALIKALVTETDVELIYCDRFVISLVRDHAQKVGENGEWLDNVFRWSSAAHVRPLIRHEEGHRTHLHVRFYAPISEERGRRLFHLLEKHQLLRHPVVFAHHKVAPGETLKSIARLYKSSRRAIRQFNELGDDSLNVGRTYAIPYQGKLEQQPEPTNVPPRLIPRLSKSLASDAAP